VISPIRLFLQLRVALEKLDRYLALHHAHQLGNRHFRRYRYHHVNVVRLDAQFFNFTTFPLAQKANVALNQALDYAAQYPESIFGAKHDVITAFPHYMILTFVVHGANIVFLA